MSSPGDFIFQTAEAVSAISLPIGAGLAAFAKWRRGAEQERSQRERIAQLAADKSAKEARQEEQAMRDKLLAEKDGRISKQDEELKAAREEIDRLHQHIFTLLSGSRSTDGQPAN